MLNLNDILAKGQKAQDVCTNPKKKKKKRLVASGTDKRRLSQPLREKYPFRPLNFNPKRVGPDQQIPSNEAGLTARLTEDLQRTRKQVLSLQAQNLFIQKVLSA